MGQTAAPPDDDLFRPTLQDRAPVVAARRPWRVGSQFWVAFFGGTLAVGAIAWLNAGRLGLPPARHRAIVLLTALATLLVTAGVVFTVTAPLVGTERTLMRRGAQLVAVLLYLALAWLQRPFDRRHAAFDGEYASLWTAGLVAIAAGFGLQWLLLFGAGFALSLIR